MISPLVSAARDRVLAVMGPCPSELVGALREVVSEGVGDLEGFVEREAMFGDEAREERAVDPTGDVVAGRDRQEGAGVVVEADCIVEARRSRPG